MMTDEEAQSALIGDIISHHPAMTEEVDRWLDRLPEKNKERIYLKIIRQSINGADVNMVSGEDENAEADLEPTPPVLSANEVMTRPWPEPKWAVPGLLPVGLLILAGAPKIGKSWLSLQLAKAVATGGEFLSVPVQRGKVLVCALEDSPQRLSKRMQAMQYPKEPDIDFVTLDQMDGWPNGILHNRGKLLARLIKKKGYQLVVIDTLSRAIPGDQQDVQIMTRELAPLQEMSHKMNCAVMLCDHHRKAGGMEGDAVADILGSTAKGAMADTVWSLYRERGKNGAKLSITGRDVEEQTLQLAFDSAECCWNNLGDAASLPITDRRQDILDVIARMKKANLNEIAQAVNQSKGHTHERLQDLVSAGRVTRVQEGKRIFYVLKEG